MGRMCSQTRLSFEELGRGGGGGVVRTYVNSKRKIPSTGDSEEDSEPKTLPTELLRPENILMSNAISTPATWQKYAMRKFCITPLPRKLKCGREFEET